MAAEAFDQDPGWLGDVEIEGGFAGGIKPKAVAAQAHVERDGLVRQATLFIVDISRRILKNGVRVVQPVKTLTEAEVAALVGHGERPLAGSGRLHGHLHHPGRQWPRMLGSGRSAPIDQEAVKRDTVGTSARGAEGESYFSGERGGRRQQDSDQASRPYHLARGHPHVFYPSSGGGVLKAF